MEGDILDSDEVPGGIRANERGPMDTGCVALRQRLLQRSWINLPNMFLNLD